MKKLISLFLAAVCVLTLQVTAFAAPDIIGQIVNSDGEIATDRYDTVQPGSSYYYIIGRSDDGYSILTNRNLVRFRLKKRTNGKYVSDAELVEKVFRNARYTCIRFSIKDNFTADEYKIEMEAQFRAMQDLVVVNYAAALAGKEFPLLQPENSSSRSSSSLENAKAAYDKAVEAERKARDAYNAKKKAYDDASDAVRQAQAAYDAAVKNQQEKQKAYDDAKAAYEKNPGSVAQEEAAYRQALQKQQDAQNAYDEAVKNRDAKAAQVSSLKSAYEREKAAYDQDYATYLQGTDQQTALQNAQSEFNQATADVTAAQKALNLKLKFDAVSAAANRVQEAANKVAESIAAATPAPLPLDEGDPNDSGDADKLDQALRQPEAQNAASPSAALVQALQEAINAANAAIQAYNLEVDPNSTTPASHIPTCVTQQDNSNNWNQVYAVISNLQANTYTTSAQDLQAALTTKEQIRDQKKAILDEIAAKPAANALPPSDIPVNNALADYNQANAELASLEQARQTEQGKLNAAKNTAEAARQALDQAKAVASSDLKNRMDQAQTDLNAAKANTAQKQKDLDSARTRQTAAQNERDHAEKTLIAAEKDAKEKLDIYNRNQKAETEVKPNFKRGETMTTHLTFWIQNENIDDDDDAFFYAGDKGIVIRPVKNAWNTVTWENNDGPIARVKFLADSDADFYCPALSTRWNRDYDKYFGSLDLDAFMYDFIGNPKLPATSRATLELYNPFVDSDGDLTVPLTDLYVYELVDGKLIDRSSTCTAGRNEDGDQVISLRTRTLGAYIISEGRANIPEEKPSKVDPGTPVQPSKPGKPNPGTGA